MANNYINILVQRLQWDEPSVRYPITVREDCIRNAFRQFLAEESEKEVRKQIQIDAEFDKENPQY